MDPLQGIESGVVDAGGLSWDAGWTGPEEGPVVVLVHGFPEHWRTWTGVMPAIAGAGFRVVAPCLPGYGRTTPPPSYRIDDVGELLAEFCGVVGGGRKVHLVGHDWGGIVGASTASLHPEHLASVTLACTAHPAAFTAGRSSPAQWKRSLYVGLFQVPGIEHLVLRGTASRKFPHAVIQISDVAEMRRALQYYRSNLRPWSLRSSRAGRIQVPGSVIHARRDVAIGENLMRATAAQMDDLRGFEILECSHFIHRRCPNEFVSSLLSFLREVSVSEKEKEPPVS